MPPNAQTPRRKKPRWDELILLAAAVAELVRTAAELII